MKAKQKCIDCCRRKAMEFIDGKILSEKDRPQAISDVNEALDKNREISAPELMSEILSIVGHYTGIQDGYEEPKHMYNQLLLDQEPAITRELSCSEDLFLSGIRCAVTGNYIDFAVTEDVQESKLRELLGTRESIRLDPKELASLKSELAAAKRLLYITDNAGEIVLDKIFIRILKELYPHLEIAVLAREYPVLNDATVKDACQIGLDRLVPILPNGTAVPGTLIEKLPPESAAWMDSADLCIAKGQGNFETLRGCGRNIYYLFLCKCDLFTEAFQVEQYTPLLVNEQRIHQL